MSISVGGGEGGNDGGDGEGVSGVGLGSGGDGGVGKGGGELGGERVGKGGGGEGGGVGGGDDCGGDSSTVRAQLSKGVTHIATTLEAMAALKVDNDFSVCGSMDAAAVDQACLEKSNKYAVVIAGRFRPGSPAAFPVLTASVQMPCTSPVN